MIVGTRRSITSLRCPDCQEKLLYDGKGLSCLVCPYVWRPPESDKSIPVPQRPDETSKKA